MINIPIKLYYTQEGDLFTQGNLNSVPLLNKLSNYAYSLYLTIPIANEIVVNEKLNTTKSTIVNAYFEKGDNTITDQYPMAFIKKVPVKVRNEEQIWYSYKLDISDDVLNISSYEHDNKLGIGFSVKIPTGQKTNDGEDIYQTLNLSPYYTSCNYTITGNARSYDDFTLDIITDYLNTMLKTKISDFDGITKTDKLPTIYSDPNDIENYNVNKLFILTNVIEGYNIGDIIAIARTGSSSYGYIKIAYGSEYIDVLINDINSDINSINEDITTINGEITGIKGNITTINGNIDNLRNRINILFSKKLETIAEADIPMITSQDSGKVYIQIDGVNAGRIFLYQYDNGNKFTELSYSYKTLFDLFNAVYNNESRIESLESRVTVNERNINTNTSSIESLRNNKLDKVFNDLALANSIGENAYFVLNSGGIAYKISFSVFKQAVYEDHYKGDFDSYEQLISQYTTAKPGDYAYINYNPATAVINDGYLDKIYINSKLTKQEVVSYLDKLGLSNGESYAVAYTNEDSNIGDFQLLSVFKDNDIYYISCSYKKDEISSTASIIFKSNSGWVVSINSLSVRGLKLINNYGTYSVGEKNELIKNLFSSEDFANADLILYIWDTDDNMWRMSNASQFLKSSVFALFQQEILNGDLVVGKAKGYTEDGEIGSKFLQLEKQTIEFSDTIEEGNESNPTVKQIKLGDDIWLIPEGKGVLLHKGSELENMEFEEGRIYLCTEESDSFQLNQLYYGDNDKNIRKLTSTLVSLEPSLTTFTLSEPTGTMEVGTSVSTVTYSFGLKYPNKLVNGYSELKYGSELVEKKTSLSTSNSSSVSYTILNSTIGTKTFYLHICSNDVSKFISSKSYTVAQRYYYGITTTDINATTLTTELANANFSSVVSNRNTVKTSLSKLSSVTLNITDYSYVWFLVPTNQSINKATSGGFDFPYQLQGNITMTNSYGIELTYKAYRSSNQVIGDVTIALS